MNLLAELLGYAQDPSHAKSDLLLEPLTPVADAVGFVWRGLGDDFVLHNDVWVPRDADLQPDLYGVSAMLRGASVWPITTVTLQADTTAFSFGFGPTSFSVGIVDDRPPRPWLTERSRRAEPITAWKRADIVARNGNVCFEGIGMDQPYAAVDTATCGGDTETDAGHLIPDPTGDCRACGFYAMADRLDLCDCGCVCGGSHMAGVATLEVELYGRVIRHSRGYRAQHQRVLAAWIDTACGRCDDPATGVRFDDDFDLEPGCAGCYPLGLVRLADVSSLLGCELRWAE